MIIKVDRENKTIIAKKTFKGKTVKAIARPSEGDSFDEEFGKGLARRKLEIKYCFCQIREHEKLIAKYKKEMEWLQNQIVYHNDVAEKLDIKVQKKIKDCKEYIEKKYK